MVLTVLPDLKVRLDRKEKQVKKEILVRLDQKEIQVKPVRKASKGTKGTKGKPEQLVHKASKV